MAYVEPAAASFKIRFPEFSPVSDELIGLVLGEAINAVGSTWEEGERALAQMLLAAHSLTLEGEPGRTLTGASAAGSGAVKSRSVGDVKVEFAGSGAGVISSAKTLGLTDTSYGSRYLTIMRKNFSGPVAV
jgi:hypothetical protein